MIQDVAHSGEGPWARRLRQRLGRRQLMGELAVSTNGWIWVSTEAIRRRRQETRQDFIANDFRIMRALDSLLISAKSIAGEDIAARAHTLRHLLKQVGHEV